MVDFTDGFMSFINELDTIARRGKFTPQAKLKPVKPKTINLNMPTLSGAQATGGSELEKLIRAIRSQESNNNYHAINRDSGALGGYQIMPFNLSFGGGSWDIQALGRKVGRNEFLKNPTIQDAIARWQLSNYLKKYGAAGAAVAWYGGPGAVKNMHSKTPQAGGYPSLYAYWTSVLNKM